MKNIECAEISIETVDGHMSTIELSPLQTERVCDTLKLDFTKDGVSCKEVDEYAIWRTNRFDDTILQERVGVFYSLELAKDFVEYQATIGESFTITKDGKIIDSLMF